MGDHDYVWVGNEASQPAESDKASHHTALLIYPHIVKKTQAETGFKASSSVTTTSEAPKPPLIYVSLHMIEIDEKTYEKQPAAIDDAVKNGDISFLQKSGGLRVLSNPAVYVTNGIKATITNEKELLRGDKSTPVTVLTAQATADANGKITRTVAPTQTMGPSKIPLGINFEVTPSLAPDGTISLPMRFSLGEVTDYKKGDDYVTRASVTDKQLIATDGKPYGFWLGDQHVYSLFDVMQLPDNPIKTLPVLSASPNRVALIVTAKQVAQN